MMQPPAAGPAHGVLCGVVVVENKDGQERAAVARLPQRRIVSEAQILAKPVNGASDSYNFV